ncbi:MAG: winged helix-turn-helix domain-containing protein [Methanotrichaceae archaeon]
MSSKRSPNIVTAQILEICTDSANKTRVIYQANLNSITGTQYLDNLTKNGLIEVIPAGSRLVYKTTPKGKELLEKLEEFACLMDQLQPAV